MGPAAAARRARAQRRRVALRRLAAAVRESIALGRMGVMPAFGERLDSAQLKMVIAWLGARSGNE